MAQGSDDLSTLPLIYLNILLLQLDDYMSQFLNKIRRNSSSIGVKPAKYQCRGGHLFLLRLELGNVNRCKFNEAGEQVNLFTIGPGELPSLKSTSTMDRLRAVFEQEVCCLQCPIVSWFDMKMASGSFPQVRKRHRFEDISNSQEESLLSAAVAPKT